METILSVSQARRQLLTLSRLAAERMGRYILTNRGEAAAVLMSFSEYKSLAASRELVNNPQVLRDTLLGMRQLKRGRGMPLSKLRRAPSTNRKQAA